MSDAPAMQRTRTGLSRVLHACAGMPAADARRVLAWWLAAPVRAASGGEAVAGGDAGAPDRVLAKRLWEIRQPAIAEMRDVIRRQFTRAKREIVAKLKAIRPVTSHQSPVTSDSPIVASGLGVSLLFDLARWTHGLLAEVRGELEHTLDTAGTQLFEEVGHDDVWTMPSPRAVKFLDQREKFIRDAAGNASEELNDTVRAAIQESLARGDSRAKMIRNIQSRVDGVSDSKANTWASTEVAAAYGEARQAALLAAGIEFKRWVCSFINSRAAHIMADEDPRNQRVPADAPFHVGGEELLFPGDSDHGSPENVINCHCLAIGVSAYEDGGEAAAEKAGGFVYDADGKLISAPEVVR